MPLTFKVLTLNHRTSLLLWSEGRPHMSALSVGQSVLAVGLGFLEESMDTAVWTHLRDF